MYRKKKGAALLSAVIVGSFAIATVIMGFAANITDGALGNIDTARDEVKTVMNDLDRSCTLGSDTRETFDPENSERGDTTNSILEVCGGESKQLCYGDYQIIAQDFSCDSIKMDDCDGIEPGQVYTTTSDEGQGVLGCE